MPMLSRREALCGAAALAAASVAGRATAAPSQLVIYHAIDFVGSASKAFTAKTGIPVKLVEQDSTGLVLGKVSAEGNHPQFDLIWIEGSAVAERLGRSKVLHAFPELTLKTEYTDVGRKIAPASGFFFPTNVSTTGIAVNTSKVAAADMPTSWADLAKPAFAGAVAAKDPNLSGPAYQWLAGLFQTVGVEKGEALLSEILTNKTLSGLPSGGAVNKQLITGNAKVGIAQDSATFSKIAAGEPLTAVYPTEGVVALPSSIAASAHSKNLDAARQFIEFVLSPEGQAAMMDGDDADFYFLPIIRGVSAKPGRKTDINFVYLDDGVASAHEVEWKKWYRDTFVP
ncbi:MAG: iron(III) transport system substrate-binding protein [Rhodospirillaceae bacterium]|nr:iron(III) transport system substrate-binding protein [Rhodospirillaceae bacterium]